MRIAFVYDMVYPFRIGGVEKRIWEMSRRLAGMGHDVHIYSLKLWEGPHDLIREGVHIHGVGRKFSFHTGKSGRRAIVPALWFSMSLFYPFLRGGKYDIIDCQNFPYFPFFTVKIISYLNKSPLFITWHEVWQKYWLDYLGSIGVCGIAIEKLVYYMAESHVAVSVTTKERLKMLGKRETIEIIPNGVDLKKIHAIPPSSECSDLIFVGRLIRDKHIDILIGAAGILRKEFPNLRCLIIGQGPEEKKLKAQIFSIGLEKNIKILESLNNHEDIISLMKSSRVCVLPSTREGFGMVALEALASGIPVVTADHPANAICDLIAIGGVSAVPLTREDFAEAIKDRLSSHYHTISVDFDNKYEWDGVTEKWLEIVRDITYSSL